MLRHLAGVLLAAGIGAAQLAAAQSYPVKSIRIMAPFPVGGNADILARISEEFADQIRRDMARWAKVARDANIQAQ